MLEGSYVELLGVVNPTPANAAQRDALARGEEGLTAVACTIGDARAAAAGLAELGIPIAHVVDCERPVDLPSGGTGRAAFSIADFAPARCRTVTSSSASTIAATRSGCRS